MRPNNVLDSEYEIVHNYMYQEWLVQEIMYFNRADEHQSAKIAVPCFGIMAFPHKRCKMILFVTPSPFPFLFVLLSIPNPVAEKDQNLYMFVMSVLCDFPF